MPQIVITSINARYTHTNLGIRYLHANLGDLQKDAQIIEFIITDDPRLIAEELLALTPVIVGIGVYIWNFTIVNQVIKILKKINPHIKIILGGPEVSHDHHNLLIADYFDYLIAGEADLAFKDVCRQILKTNKTLPPTNKYITSSSPTLDQLVFPYNLYSDEDLKNRIIYVEASRGCPFKCAFCLSSLDSRVRNFPLPEFLTQLDILWQRGARKFKFIDRTFNLSIKVVRSILQFFLSKQTSDLFLHFEVVPDKLSTPIMDLLSQFEKDTVQLEIGIQSFNPQVLRTINRQQDFPTLMHNIKYLKEHTQTYLHADLIVGLPGEDFFSFADGFDQLITLNPDEIQVGILKRLKGTPICQLTDEFALVFDSEPPYEILQTKDVSFKLMQQMRRFTRYWQLYYNSRSFINSIRLVWTDKSPFAEFFKFSGWLYRTSKKVHAISLANQAQYLGRYLIQEKSISSEEVNQVIRKDYLRKTGKTLTNINKGNQDHPNLFLMSIYFSSSNFPILKTTFGIINSNIRGLKRLLVRIITSLDPASIIQIPGILPKGINSTLLLPFNLWVIFLATVLACTSLGKPVLGTPKGAAQLVKGAIT